MIKILIIDDEEVDSIICSKLIEKVCKDSKVEHRINGIEALTYLNGFVDKPSEWHNIIFIDINMPRMNGFQFVEKYKEFPSALIEKSKLYIVSSSNDPKDQQKASEYGIISEFITKPLSIPILEKITKG
jgi:CheY-like chemotaxis protein